MADVMLYETGNGGDAQIKGNDLALTDAIFNQVYIALFGGNTAENHPQSDEEQDVTEERFDFWGNSLFFENEPDHWFVSDFERALNEVALTSQGRAILEEAAKNDLAFLNELGSVAVSSKILGLDKFELTVKVQEPDNEENKTFKFIWDATKGELIQDIII